MPATTRLISADDAERLAVLQRTGRIFFAPWEPVRQDPYFTVAGQQAEVENVLARHSRGEALPHVILDEDAQVVGRITFSGITYGAFQSCNMGYWVAEENNGRGYATDAVRAMTTRAFEELGLHRVQAETLIPNVRSQRVLQRVGFVRYGLAPAYLKIAGRWQDHLMYQLLADPRCT
ncbi:N-acetyltransferase [Cryobacterium sp. TMS1-13-1]|nr:N-acetyltransferase [Cryobacterium sp. TMS1-13-1]